MGVLKGPSPLRLAKALTSLAHSSMSPLFFFFSPPSLLFQLLALLFVFQSSVDFVRKCAKISEPAFAGCLIFERDRDKSEEEVEDRVVRVGFCFLLVLLPSFCFHKRKMFREENRSIPTRCSFSFPF